MEAAAHPSIFRYKPVLRRTSIRAVPWSRGGTCRRGAARSPALV